MAQEHHAQKVQFDRQGLKLVFMSITVDIDSNSGFCAGVIRAIGKAEEFLDGTAGNGKKLFSLGAIVHNDAELKRLEDKGLVCIDRDDLDDMLDADGCPWVHGCRLYMSGSPQVTEKHKGGICGAQGQERSDCDFRQAGSC